MISRPDLVHLDRAGQESGADQKQDPLPETIYTGIWWYARFPDHYSGDGTIASKELGEADMKRWVLTIAEAIRAIKADENSLRLQNEFFEKGRHPLDTKQ
jgi:creatinine amidohydrolase